MPLVVHNTRTRQKEPFVPAHPRVVRIYTCGLTVYAPMHIGHARTYCFWDTFRRWLEYRGYHVLSVINYTDIDDRINAGAMRLNLGSVDIHRTMYAAAEGIRDRLVKDDIKLDIRAADDIGSFTADDSPAYAEIMAEHTWNVAWADIVTNGMKTSDAVDKALKRIQEIFAKSPVQQS